MGENKPIRRALAMVAAAVALGAPAGAYYHYTYYASRTAVSSPIRAAFNLAALPNSTVTFYVNDAGPSTFYPNDSFGSVLAEVKQALAAWNAVASSNLRVAFGGLESAGQTENAPGGDVVFMELPPGLIGMGSPNLPATPNFVNGPNGPYVPILRSTVVLTNDTSQVPGPSYYEGFFTTAVHEIGHALGLQHTWTSSAMSQNVVRNTTRTRPLDADDIAALSVLYGGSNWAAGFGTISGKVSFTGGSTGVSLASVVAIPPNGPAVSALTNPDGSYTINGLPVNSYLVYVHPLPPDAIPAQGEGLLLPEDQAGRPFPASAGAFQTVFYPAVLDPTNATTFNISAGSNYSGVNFSVRPQANYSLYDVSTYGYLDPVARDYTIAPPANFIGVDPAFVDATQPRVLIAASANSGSTPVPQSVALLGGFSNAVVQAAGSPVSLFCYFYVPLGAGSGPRHMIFNLGNDLYVLPDAVTLALKGPPYISNVATNGDGTVTVSGTGFGPDSKVYFDGIQVNGTTFNASQGSITVTPPVGGSGQTSTVTIYNSDGQNSLFLQAGNPPAYTYPAAAIPQITANPTALPAGVSAMVDISGSNTSFVDGQITVGFGTTDITVSRVWVLSPTHLIANVTVSPNAAIGSSEITVISGFQVINQPFAFQIQPANPVLPVVTAVVNWSAGQATLYPGAVVSVYGTNLTQSVAGTQVTVGGSPAQILGATTSQVNFLMPGNLPTGPAILTLNNGAGSVSLVVPISNTPPAITGITNGLGTVLDATHAANPGDVLTAQVSGLDPSVAGSTGRLQVTVAGVNMTVLQISGSQIQFVMGQSFGGSVVPVTVVVDGSAGASYSILAH